VSPRPVPTGRAFRWLAFGLLPAALTPFHPGFAWAALGLDLAVLVLSAWDARRAPGPGAVRVSRTVASRLTPSRPEQVTVRVENLSGSALRGEARDAPPDAAVADVERHHQRLECPAGAAALLGWTLTPLLRGPVPLTAVHLRLEGPLGLCARQFAVPLPESPRAWPDAGEAAREALALALASRTGGRGLRRVGEGREFESLREYRPGDDVRSVDWKASARRGRTVVREHRPERNQRVLLLLDCGRHMAGEVEGRRKLDWAVDAALRLAHVSLSEGDQVAAVAYARTVLRSVPPQSGPGGLRALLEGLSDVQASLEESDVGAALELAFARQHRRTLVVTFTDLLDPDGAEKLLQRTASLRRRHLPVIVSLHDPEVARAAHEPPADVDAAYVRCVAGRLESDALRAVGLLRAAGAWVVRAPGAGFSAAAVNAYLQAKARGAL
jgi:uncharacterized protein (DUF58 family)